MRNLVFVLVLANLALAAWHAWFDPAPRARESAPVEPGMRSITLVSEAPFDPASTGRNSTSGEAASAASATDAGCTRIGPFRDDADAIAAAATLRAAGFEPTQRALEGDLFIGYWVYIDAIPSAADANEILARVRGGGITDSYVIPDDAGNLISLGVFTETARAEMLRDQVRALGYEPTVVDRTRRAMLYWLDVSGADQPIDLETLRASGRNTRLERRGCA